MIVSVLGAPTSAGAYGVGQEQAPRALRAAGLLTTLRREGLTVDDDGDVPVAYFAPDPANTTAQNLDRVVDVAQAVASRVAGIIERGSVPLVVGGDCTITLGVIAGLLRAGGDPTVAYVDGDLDLSTPETTRSGVLDAMGVAHMLDIEGVADPLAGIAGRRPLLDGPSLALIGFEDIDNDEVALLDEHGVHRHPASQLRDDPIQTARKALDALGSERPLLVHFDVDAVDSVDCPLAHFPHFNVGSSLSAVTDCLSVLCGAPNLAAVVITEVNPHHDHDGSQLRRVVGSLSSALASDFETA